MIEEMKREFEERFMLGESLDDYDSYFERDADTIRELYGWFESKLKSEIAEACKKQRQETLNLCKTSLPNARILNAHSEYVKGWEDANRQHIRFIENLNAPSPKEEV